MLALPFSQPSWHPQGLEIITGAVIPAVAPMIIILIMLDILMSKVWQSDSVEPAEKKRFGRIIKTHLIVATLLFLFFLEAFNEALF